MFSGDVLEAIHDAEIDVFRAMNAAGTNVLADALMVAFTLLGISYVIVLVCVPLWLRGRKEAAFDAVVIVILAAVIAEMLKLLVDRQRPSLELVDVRTILPATGPSFPSGHATRAFAVALLVYTVESRKIGLLALVVATLISASRVYLGVHWPLDILAGGILGIATAFAVIECAKRSERYVTLRKRVVQAIEGRLA
jgi:undecaprenyl-diphosphatase